MTRVRRLIRLSALPILGEVVAAAAQSATVRELAAHARRDPRGFARHVTNPTTAVGLAQRAGNEPSVRHLVSAGLLFLPLRYFAVAQAAIWSARHVGHRRRAGEPMAHDDSRSSSVAATRPSGHQVRNIRSKKPVKRT